MHEHRVNTTGAQELKNKKVNIAPVTKDRCDVNQLCILLLKIENLVGFYSMCIITHF